MAAIVIAAVTLAHVAMTPAVSPDAALGLLAVEQRLRHRQDAIDRVVLADHRDAERNLSVPITWWSGTPADGALSPVGTAIAPGHQSLVYTWRLTGATLGGAVKASAITAWLIGIAAWAGYFLMVVRDRRLAWLIVAAFACFRMSHYNAYVYLGGETLLWAAFPVTVVVSLRAAARGGRAGWAFFAGTLAVLLIAIKPSALLLTVALGLWWAVLSYGDRAYWRAATAWGAGAIAGGLAGITMGLMPSPLAIAAPVANYCVNDPWAVAGGVAGGWLLGLSDLNAALEWATRTSMGTWSNPQVAALGAALAALFAGWWATTRPRPDDMASNDGTRAIGLAVLTVAVVAVGIGILQLRDSCISFEGRHQQYGGFLALPLLASALAAALRRGGRAARAWSVALALALVAAPTAYGAGALTDKLFGRLPARTGAIGADGLLRQWIAPGAEAARVDDALSRALPSSAVLVTTSAVVALAYPARRLAVAWGPPVESPVPAAGLAVLLPRWTPESDAEARARVPSVRRWTTHDLGGGVRLLVAGPP